MVIWPIVNLEVWDISRPMPRAFLSPPNGLPLMPDVPNWSWHEYGMRVGVWRFFKLFRELGIRPTLSINARVCEDYRRVAEEARDAGWEFMAHAYDQVPMHKLDDQPSMIARTLDVIEAFTTTRPIGWLGPGLTISYLRKAFDYFARFEGVVIWNGIQLHDWYVSQKPV
jgi:peptidoglycan/xylan/chitin deacetylase (PgdA/CDA1 family)